MTRLKSLKFGSKRDEVGYPHRIHTPTKNRKQFEGTKFGRKAAKKIKARMTIKEKSRMKRDLMQLVGKSVKKTKKGYMII